MTDDFAIDWSDCVLIPEGEYQVKYLHHETKSGSFGPKVKITFQIISMGRYFEQIIHAWYNIKSSGKKSGRNPKIGLSRHSKLTNELLKVLQIKKRVDRLSLSDLKNHILVVKVRTVKTNSTQKQLASALHYSVVDSMVSCLTLTDISDSLLLPEPLPEPVPT
jgi:hypothetical protein